MKFYSSLPQLCLWKSSFSYPAWLPGFVDFVGLQYSLCGFSLAGKLEPGLAVNHVLPIDDLVHLYHVSLVSPFLQSCQSKLLQIDRLSLYHMNLLCFVWCRLLHRNLPGRRTTRRGQHGHWERGGGGTLRLSRLHLPPRQLSHLRLARLLPPPRPSPARWGLVVAIYGFGSALIRVSWIRIRIGNAYLNPRARKFMKIYQSTWFPFSDRDPNSFLQWL